MKKLVLSIIFALSLSFASGQIILESTYNYSGTYTRLANSGYKYYVMDVVTSQCRIYNTNHTLWKTIGLSVPVNNYLYDIKFISENLFTTDNALCLAYMYYNYNTAGQYYTYTAKVVRENGTELLSIPGCQYIYVYNLTGIGTKMLTYSFDYSVSPYTIQTRFYHLPGQLITAANQPTEPFDELMRAFPNPAHDFTTIPYQLPDGVSKGELTIADLQGRVIASYAVDGNMRQLTIRTAQYPRGTYIYSVQAGSYTSMANKLVIQ